MRAVMDTDQGPDNGLASRSIVAASWEFGSVIGQAAMQLAVMTILARLIPRRNSAFTRSSTPPSC